MLLTALQRDSRKGAHAWPFTAVHGNGIEGRCAVGPSMHVDQAQGQVAAQELVQHASESCATLPIASLPVRLAVWVLSAYSP